MGFGFPPWKYGSYFDFQRHTDEKRIPDLGNVVAAHYFQDKGRIFSVADKEG